MKLIKKISITIIIILFVIIGIYLAVFCTKFDNYKAMKGLPIGYSNGEVITINEKTYDIAKFNFDTERYLFKGIDENNPYHIITSDFIIFSVVKDYLIYPSIDDPNGYIFTHKTNFLDADLEYFSNDIELPNYQKNEIRQLLVVFSPLQHPSSGYTTKIKDYEVIQSILDCIANDGDPTAIINQKTDMLNENFKIWIDYSDFPMYELIYSNYTENHSKNAFDNR